MRPVRVGERWLGYPDAMPDIAVNRRFLSKVGVHVVDTGGTGRPVVLIHGWPLSSASWKEQITTIATSGSRVIAYDRRGFGQSDKPGGGYDYDTLAADLHGLIGELDLHDVTLAGFSMGGGEVARYVSTYGTSDVHSVVFAAAVTPAMMQSPDNPEGPLTAAKAEQMTAALSTDREAFFDDFTRDFFSANGVLLVTEEQRQEAIEMCRQSDPHAALASMASFGTDDFRQDLGRVNVPTLVIHGDADAIVPFEGSGARTHRAIAQSELVVLAGAPHGCNITHADAFNAALIDFLHRQG